MVSPTEIIVIMCYFTFVTSPAWVSLLFFWIDQFLSWRFQHKEAERRIHEHNRKRQKEIAAAAEELFIQNLKESDPNAFAMLQLLQQKTVPSKFIEAATEKLNKAEI